MKKRIVKTGLRQGLLAGVAATVLLGAGVTAAQAQPRAEQRRERLEERQDRREDRRDRRKERMERRKDRRQDRLEHRRDLRQDRRELRKDRRDRRHDRWERRHDRRDKREFWSGKRWHKKNHHHKKGCACGACSGGWGWGGWIRYAPRAEFGGDVFFRHGDWNVYFGGYGLHLELGDRPPDGFVYIHAQTGKRFGSVRTFQRWCRRNPRYEPFLVVAPCY